MNRLLSEFWSTFFLVLVGTGSIVLDQHTDGWVTNGGISFSFGMIVTLMIWVYAKYSGSHMNPAVTIALGLSGVFEKKAILSYVGVQIIAAICASLLLKLLFPLNETLGMTYLRVPVSKGFLVEMGMSFLLMMVILFTARISPAMHWIGAVVIGATVGLEAYFGGGLTGASMNPARSIGPAIVSGNLNELWIYLLAPITGMIMASLLWKVQMNKLIRID